MWDMDDAHKGAYQSAALVGKPAFVLLDAALLPQIDLALHPPDCREIRHGEQKWAVPRLDIIRVSANQLPQTLFRAATGHCGIEKGMTLDAIP